MTPPPALAVVLSTGEPERLYSGLSLLVSSAVDGSPCRALATFRALELVLAPDLARRGEDPDATPLLTWAGRETFGRSLDELRDTALGLDALAVHACSASVDTMGLAPAQVEERLRGVMSMPRFLREVAGAPLVFV